MEQHINIRYSLQNFPRHHKKYIDYFLTDYVVEKARVSSEWWNFWEKVWSGEALVHTPSNERNRRHIQSDHYSKYAFQKASRKILNLFPDIYGRYMILFLKKMWLSLLSWETAFFFLKESFHQEKQTMAYDWTGSKFSTKLQLNEKTLYWRSWFVYCTKNKSLGMICIYRTSLYVKTSTLVFSSMAALGLYTSSTTLQHHSQTHSHHHSFILSHAPSLHWKTTMV